MFSLIIGGLGEPLSIQVAEAAEATIKSALSFVCCLTLSFGSRSSWHSPLQSSGSSPRAAPASLAREHRAPRGWAFRPGRRSSARAPTRSLFCSRADPRASTRPASRFFCASHSPQFLSRAEPRLVLLARGPACFDTARASTK
jgi:hypothetical protein